MKSGMILAAVSVLACLNCWAGEPIRESSKEGTPSGVLSSNRDEHDEEQRAEKRYEEMLNKMQAAVEEIAQLYGNPIFVQIFTNDTERASELKLRLKAAKNEDDIRRELAELKKKRDELLNDIALKERETNRLTGRLVRQRIALEAVATALDQARKAVEDTAR